EAATPSGASVAAQGRAPTIEGVRVSGRAAAVTAAIALLALTGCAPTAETYENVTVVEGGDGLALLCIDGATATEPPECSAGSPAIFAWDWIGLDHREADGVRWGQFRIVGEQFGDMFMMVEPPSNA